MTYQEMADEIAETMQHRLGVRGRDLETKLNRAGRLLPKPVRAQADMIVQSLKYQGHPRLERRQDDASIQRAHAATMKHLNQIDARDRRRGLVISFLSTNAFNLLVIVALLLAVLRWRGYL